MAINPVDEPSLQNSDDARRLPASRPGGVGDGLAYMGRLVIRAVVLPTTPQEMAPRGKTANDGTIARKVWLAA
jgi:hypothetical protein